MLSIEELLFQVAKDTFIFHSLLLKRSNRRLILLLDLLNFPSQVSDLSLKFIDNTLTLINVILMSYILLIFICYPLTKVIQIIVQLFPIILSLSQEFLK